MTISQQQNVLDQFARRARRLYSLPAVAMKVVELTREPRIDTQAIKACLENDPALSTKVLRVVNSSLFGLSQKVADLNQALAILGIKPLKLLVLGFSLPDELFSGVEANVLSRYWKQALIKAVAAREVAEKIWDLPGDEAFIAGLLQDIGMLALIQDLGVTYISFLDRVQDECEDLTSLEVSTLGFDHAMLSARMLRHWSLPDSLVRAVALPRNATRLLGLSVKERDLPQILHLAYLVTEFLIHQSPERVQELLETGKKYKEFNERHLEALVASLEEKVPLLADALALQIPDGTSYTEILLSAYRQLSDAADETAPELVDDVSRAHAILSETAALSKAVQRFVGVPMVETGSTVDASTATAVANRTVVAAEGDDDPGSVRTPADARALLTHVTAAVARCRQSRCAISLLMVEVDDLETLILTRGLERATKTMNMLASAIEVATDQDGLMFQLNEARFALILKDHDRENAVSMVRQLLQGIRHWSQSNATSRFSISAGLAALAMPPKNFCAQSLIDAAERCLSGVLLSGGDGLKSIDIY